jgi:hypothetical protein
VKNWLQSGGAILTLASAFQADSPPGGDKTRNPKNRNSMKQSITEKFAADAINAPAAVTGGGGKKGGGKRGGSASGSGGKGGSASGSGGGKKGGGSSS